MNTPRDDGGRAFPSDTFKVGELGHYGSTERGMSLRDYFAAKAMAAMIGTAAAPCLMGLDGAEHVNAQAAYRIADAMIAMRNAA